MLNSPQRRWDCIRKSSNTKGVNCKVCWTQWGFQTINRHVYVWFYVYSPNLPRGSWCITIVELVHWQSELSKIPWNTHLAACFCPHSLWCQWSSSHTHLQCCTWNERMEYCWCVLQFQHRWCWALCKWRCGLWSSWNDQGRDYWRAHSYRITLLSFW